MTSGYNRTNERTRKVQGISPRGQYAPKKWKYGQNTFLNLLLLLLLKANFEKSQKSKSVHGNTDFIPNIFDKDMISRPDEIPPPTPRIFNDSVTSSNLRVRWNFSIDFRYRARKWKLEPTSNHWPLTTDHYRFVHSPGVTHLSIVSIKRDDYKNDGWWHEHYILARSKIYCQKHKIIIIIHHHLSKNIERHHKSNNIYIVENGHPLPLSQTIPHYTQPQLVPSKRPVSRAVEKSPFYK